MLLADQLFEESFEVEVESFILGAPGGDTSPISLTISTSRNDIEVVVVTCPGYWKLYFSNNSDQASTIAPVDVNLIIEPEEEEDPGVENG